MCTVNEYYNLDLESCLPCSTCEDGDTVMVKCSYFEDTVCQKDFWQGFVLLSEPLPTSPYIPRGPGPRTVEVLPEDWTSGPAVSMAMSAFGLSLFVAVIIILGCICKKSWSQKKDKIIYLTREYVGYRDPGEEEEPRYQPLPSRGPTEKNTPFSSSSSIHASDCMLNMPNTHIYVNMLDYLDSDYCTIDDDFEER
uniref:Uncharacterized protein LOC111110538 n=1 Tax=Crassostrea virginica TaxID=6565 RepID=A0A8B8BIY3_CRAVI|nr:uncharacterized protein LOC111110538 [Crassostrea virginica]XP_022302797.1 uncharacterized protein LOC111110538 [Crassostrea virginica]